MGMFSGFKDSARQVVADFWLKAGLASIGSHGFPSFEYKWHFHRCIRFLAANGVQGDILEFGVFRGDSLLLLDRLARILRKRQGIEYRIFGFDSFEGLPEPRGVDADVHGDHAVPGFKLQQGSLSASKDEVLARLRRGRADLSRIHLVPGWYDRVLTPDLRQQLGLRAASLINVDCDLYESTRVVLSWVAPLITDGTLINFDDWFCYQGRPDHGEQRAFQEFLGQNPSLTASPFGEYAWNGKAFVLNRT